LLVVLERGAAVGQHVAVDLADHAETVEARHETVHSLRAIGPRSSGGAGGFGSGLGPGIPSSGALALDQHPRPSADRQGVRLYVRHDQRANCWSTACLA
jgi:hypothetical protein